MSSFFNASSAFVIADECIISLGASLASEVAAPLGGSCDGSMLGGWLFSSLDSVLQIRGEVQVAARLWED